MLDQLQKLGLNPKEAAVYMAAMELGVAVQAVSHGYMTYEIVLPLRKYFSHWYAKTQ